MTGISWSTHDTIYFKKLDLFTLALKFNLTFYTVIPVIGLEAKPVMSMVKFL